MHGVDYIANGTDDPQVFFYMTSGCFARVAMKMTMNARAVQVRQYCTLVDQALRDQMGESLQSRLQIEDPKVTTIKEDHPEYISFGEHEAGTYNYVLRGERGEATHTGVTDDMNTRFQSHKARNPGFISKLHYKGDAEMPRSCVTKHR